MTQIGFARFWTAGVVLFGLFWVAEARSDETADLQRFRQSAVHMGVEFEVELYAASETQAAEAFKTAFARIATLDKALSDYDPTSELSRLSETSAVPLGSTTLEPPQAAVPVKLSDDLWKVLRYSNELSLDCDGAFDVSIGPLTKLWRRARRQNELPMAERVVEARASVGHKLVKLDPQAKTAQLLRTNMRLDLGGVAKGFAAEEALAAIKKRGIPRAVLVRASGDIAVGDPPPGTMGWRIGIAPLNPDDPPARFVQLANQAISTSGDSRQHLVVDGRRYSHIIDPRTGECVSGRSSVSVIATSGMEADALATAVSVLGPEKGKPLVLKLPGVELLMVVEDESGKQRTVESPGFSKYQVATPSK